jgi:hypothetical protein
MDHYSRQDLVDVLRHAGLPDLADEASRTLPDPVAVTQLEAWAVQHGFSSEERLSWLLTSGLAARLTRCL